MAKSTFEKLRVTGGGAPFLKIGRTVVYDVDDLDKWLDGKGGDQRGTSRREDCLDTVIRLARPEDYRAEEGARFEIHLDKARAVFGDDAKPFEAKLEVRDGAAIWTTRDIEDRELELVMRLTEEGLSVREIQDETGISRSKVNRLQHQAREEAG